MRQRHQVTRPSHAQIHSRSRSRSLHQSTKAEREKFVRAWGESLTEFGFVSIINHGVDDGLIRRTYEITEKLFDLPLETKKKYDVPNGGGQRGYTSFGKEHAKNRKVGDLKEFCT